ncbi:NAD-dependent epimerase/dehydratase family protein [Vibrio owensii]|uniref:NAD-dependent epimerase/dehydratase family protein n=1 Tax=Vibrio owensii TaxID=696485 RepID=UPI0005F08E00|nr:SDR family oxidoreductase [Vibrio owensii]
MGKYTVFGGKGFIGAEFVAQLKEQGHDVMIPERGDYSCGDDDLGTVIFAAGHGDCNHNSLNVVDANLTLLSKVIEKARFEKLVYISSTRVYMNGPTSYESSDSLICESDSRKLFNLTKLAAEEICLRNTKQCLIIRPSNVYGVAINSPLFLPAITRHAVTKKRVDMYVSKEYAKDYVSVFDVVDSTLRLINLNMKEHAIVNIASGINITALEIAEHLQRETNCDVIWHDVKNNDEEVFPKTDVSKISSLIKYEPRHVLNDLSDMILRFKKVLR